MNPIDRKAWESALETYKCRLAHWTTCRISPSEAGDMLAEELGIPLAEPEVQISIEVPMESRIAQVLRVAMGTSTPTVLAGLAVSVSAEFYEWRRDGQGAISTFYCAYRP